jgi:hypothetical protein
LERRVSMIIVEGKECRVEARGEERVDEENEEPSTEEASVSVG